MQKLTPKTTKTPSRSDRICWHLFKQRMSMDEIATRQKMSIIQVGNAIQRMEDARSVVSDEEVKFAFNTVIMKHVGGIDKAIAGGLKAQVVTRERVSDTKYKTVRRPDHATHLKTIETAKALIETFQPKGGGVNIALQQNNNGGNNESRPQGHSFEERLRKIREAKGLTNNDVVVEAEYVDPPSLEDELADIGIELEDEDEDDELDEEEDDDGSGTP